MCDKTGSYLYLELPYLQNVKTLTIKIMLVSDIKGSKEVQRTLVDDQNTSFEHSTDGLVQ